MNLNENHLHHYLVSFEDQNYLESISDSPSRNSAKVLLLKNGRSNIGKHLQHYICLTFVIILITFCVLIVNGFFVTFNNCTTINLTNDTQFQNNPELVNEDKLNHISRQLINELKSSNIKLNLDYLSSHAHIAGTREQTRLMHYLADQYEKLGLSVKVYNYTVLLNYPQLSSPNLVEVKISNDDEWQILSNGRGVPLGPKVISNEQGDIRAQQWWNAYSPNGSVTSQIVYCNYGRKEDYNYLSRQGISVKGKIGLMRYGIIKRFEKVRIAYARGLVGVLFFSDPMHYTSINKTNVFPASTYLPGHDAQRGSILATQGDPLTPLLPSLIYTHREFNEETSREKGILPKIPVTPISYNDAKDIMHMMDGKITTNFEWRGGLMSNYRLASTKLFRMTVNSRFIHRTISNVIATLKGSQESDKWIIVGNHVDAWGNGAIDPISGTATQLELARAMSVVYKESPPRRTVVFCHWDAEEFGLIGSSEWVEEMQHVLLRRAVAYINVDHIAGGVTPDVKSVPLLYRAISNAAKKTKQLNKRERSFGRIRLFDSWRHYRGKGPILGDRSIPEIGLPSTGSDYQRFIGFLGIPSADLRLENIPGSSYPLYHTMYETSWMVNELMEEPYDGFLTLGSFWIELTHRLASSPIVPFDVLDYSNVIGSLVYKTESYLNRLNITRQIPSINDQLFLLKDAVKRFQVSSREFQQFITDSHVSSTNAQDIQIINNRLYDIEQCFIDWTLGSTLNRHIIFSSSRTNPHISFLASIQDAAKEFIINGRNDDVKKMSLSFSRFQLAIESAIKTLLI